MFFVEKSVVFLIVKVGILAYGIESAVKIENRVRFFLQVKIVGDFCQLLRCVVGSVKGKVLCAFVPCNEKSHTAFFAQKNPPCSEVGGVFLGSYVVDEILRNRKGVFTESGGFVAIGVGFRFAQTEIGNVLVFLFE